MLKGLYTQGAAARGSVRISVKTSIISVSNVRQVLHSKPSYTKFVLATCKISRMKAIATFKNEFWCMDLYYVDKLAKNANGVKYLLVCQDVYDKTVDSKRIKTRNSKETVRTFSTVSKKNKQPTENWFEKGTEFPGEYQKLCKAEGNQIYSTMSETKAAFAECTIRSSKNLHYCYMDNYEDKDIHKLSHSVTTFNSRKNCAIDLIPKIVKISDFLSILYSRPLREHKKPKFKIGDRVRISKYDLPFRKCYKPQSA